MRARRAGRGVLVDDTAGVLTQLLATLRPKLGLSRRCLGTFLTRWGGWIGPACLSTLFDQSPPCLAIWVLCCVQSPGGLVLPATSTPACPTMWVFVTMQSPGGVVLPAIQSRAC